MAIEDPAGLAQRVEALSVRLLAVEERLQAVERRAQSGAAAERTGAEQLEEAWPQLPGMPSGGGPGLVPLTGRTFLVLGGGYLLRAVADAGLAPVAVVSVVGLGYAASWLAIGDRQARTGGHRASATFHALAALVVAFPLIVETTLRFRAWSATLGAVFFCVATVAGLLVGQRRELSLIRWASVIVGVGTGVVLLARARDPLPVTLALVALAAFIEWRTWTCDARLRWPVALGADLAVLTCAALAARREGLPEGYAPAPAPLVAMAALLLPATYVVSAALSLAARRTLGAFELLQAPAALLIGLGGAFTVLDAATVSTRPLWAVTVVLGVACYWAGFAFVDRRAGQRTTFYAYATLAASLILTGLAMLLPPAVFGICCGLLALAAAALGERFDRMTLRWHTAVYAIAGAAATGLLGTASDGIAARAGGPWREAGLPALAAAGLIAASYLRLARSPRDTPRFALVPRAALAALLAWSLAGVGLTLLASAVASAPGAEADAARLGALRMVVIAGLCVALAGAGGQTRLLELRWLVYPLLAAGALKLLAEDLRVGRPLTLFVALAAYGGALIASPRFLARRES